MYNAISDDDNDNDYDLKFTEQNPTAQNVE